MSSILTVERGSHAAERKPMGASATIGGYGYPLVLGGAITEGETIDITAPKPLRWWIEPRGPLSDELTRASEARRHALARQYRWLPSALRDDALSFTGVMLGQG